MTSRASLHDNQNSNRRAVVNWLLIAILLPPLALFGAAELAEASANFHLAAGPSPYFIAGKWPYYNILLPIFAVAVSLLFMLPGALFALALGLRRSSVELVLASFALSMLVLCGGAIVYHRATGIVLSGHAFSGLILASIALGWVAMFLSQKKGRNVAPAADWNLRDFGFVLTTGILLLATMSAKFYWENFSADGVGALNFARIFMYSDWPFWPESAGRISVAPGITSFLFDLPNSWYLRLMGESETAIRIPYVLYIMLLHAVLIGMIRLGRDIRLGIADHVAIIAVLLIFAMSMTFSGGYHPYFGDSPMPAARETMVVALFLGYVYFVMAGQFGTAAWVGLLGYLALPTAGLWMLLTLCAYLVVRGFGDRAALAKMFAILVVAAAIGTLGPFIIRALDMPIPGSEFGVKGIVNRLRFVTFWEPNRWAYLIVPTGIVAAFSMVLWRRQDDVQRVLVLITAVFFLFFYFQAYRVLPHHFMPIMMVPLIVWFRYDFAQNVAGRASLIAGLLLSAFLSFPNNPNLHGFSREIGQQTELRGPIFSGFDPKALDVFHKTFEKLFPIRYADRDVHDNYFGGPLVWLFYAQQPKPEGAKSTYLLQPSEMAVPERAKTFDRHLDYTLYILDEEAHQRNFATTFPNDYSAPIYFVPRDEIFGRGTGAKDRYIIDLVAIGRRLLGVEMKTE